MTAPALPAAPATSGPATTMPTTRAGGGNAAKQAVTSFIQTVHRNPIRSFGGW